MIMAKPAHTMPKIRAEKLRGAPVGRDLRQFLESRECSDAGPGLNLTFPNARVEQDAPGEPHGRGQGQCILLLLLTVHLESAKGTAECKEKAGERAGEAALPSPAQFCLSYTCRGWALCMCSPEAVQQVQHHCHHMN